MAMVVSLAILKGEQMLAHSFASHTAQYGAEGAKVLQLDGWGACYDKQEMDRHSIFRTKFDTFTADAQGDMHLVNAENLSMGNSDPMTDSSALYAFATKHASFEALHIR